MRLLMLSNLFPPDTRGGYELACANVAAGLVGRGHQVQVLAGRSPLPDLQTTVPIERCFNLNWFAPAPPSDAAIDQFLAFQSGISDANNTVALLDRLRAFRPDLVYVWNLFGLGAVALLDLLNMLDVPWVLHLMDNLAHHLVSVVPAHARTVFGGSAADLFAAGRVIAMSEVLLEESLLQSGLAFDGGVDIVPGWVDMDAVPAAPSVRPPGPTRFVAAARIEPHKGIDLILDAAAELRAAGVGAFTVDLFGEGEVPRYIDMAGRLGLGECVRFLGQCGQAELLSRYGSYDAFLFPTWEREPFGFAPIEAAACGCVPILTRQCGAAERLVDVAHCIKIDRTVSDLAAAMRQIVEGTVDLAAMSRRAAALVRQDLSFRSTLDRIEAILAGATRGWDPRMADDPGLPLLIHTKHHLASAMMFRA